jgi:hypothetical protein
MSRILGTIRKAFVRAGKNLRACSKSGILALQTLKFYLAGSIEPKVRRARKSGFLRSTGRKNPQFEQALNAANPLDAA